MHTYTDSCPVCAQDYEAWIVNGIEDLVQLGEERPNYLLGEIRKHGAVAATRSIVGKTHPSEGFIRLLMNGYKDRTLEACVLDNGLPCPLFDFDLQQTAKLRLGQ